MDKDNKPDWASKFIKVPVSESPVMSKKIQLLRQKNRKLKKIIEYLLDSDDVELEQDE